MKTIDKNSRVTRFKEQKLLNEGGQHLLVENPTKAQKLLPGSKPGSASLISELIKIKSDKFRKNQVMHYLYASIGFCLSWVLIIGAFELKMSDQVSVVEISSGPMHDELLVEIPVTEQPPPPPPMVAADQIIEVSDEQIIEEIEVTLDIEMTQDTRIEEVVVSNFVIDKPKAEVADEIFTIVEQQPSPVGGMQAFYKYVGENMEYPPRALRMGVQGRVFVQFVVERDGTLTDVQVVRGIGAGCDEEAIRVVQNSPKWEPGKQRGRPVRVRMVLPILFKLY
ncbi:MAG: energy transducer TonB [Cyclobacteriaceae bacterium]